MHEPALCRVAVSVRWGDMDALGHINNAAYATYVEEARIHWLHGIEPAWQSLDPAPVVAAQHINYRQSIAWPQTLEVALTTRQIGRSSATIDFCIRAADDPARVFADGHSVLVWVDRKTNAACPLPPAMRAAMGADI